MLLVSLASLASPAAASHQTSDFANWDLVDYEVRTWGASFTYVHTYFGQIQWRWLDTPTKTTVISSNYCGDLGMIGKNDFPAGASGTQYRSIGGGVYANTCFRVRGRTATGSGGMYNHDGRLNW